MHAVVAGALSALAVCLVAACGHGESAPDVAVIEPAAPVAWVVYARDRTPREPPMWSDYLALRDSPPGRVVAPVASVRQVLMRAESNWSTVVIGTTPEWLELTSRRISRGENLSLQNLSDGAAMVVLGSTVAHQLFGDDVDPVGQSLRVREGVFTVVGVLASDGMSETGADRDDLVVIPVTTYRRRFAQAPDTKLSHILVGMSATDEGAAELERATILEVVSGARRLAPGEDTGLEVRPFPPHRGSP